MIFLEAIRLPACGPDFPNNLLDRGDQAVLDAPVADFDRELERMKLVSATTHAAPVIAGQNFNDQTSEAEITDLAAALKREKISSELATAILQAHLAQRMKLNAYLAQLQQLTNTNAPPMFPAVAVTPMLPPEFAEYFAGAMAWHKGDNLWDARNHWENILELPAQARHFKSIWAAYMLGQYYERNPEQIAVTNAAMLYFEEVRALAKAGFADSAGLATESLGAEAQLYLRQNDYERAIELYLEQFAGGGYGSVESLRVAAARALAGTNSTGTSLERLALNPRTRGVITAYLISRSPYTDLTAAENDPDARQSFDRTTAWLNAVEAAGVKDMDSAGQLALAAYQTGRWDNAQRWINRAGREPVAQWLQAKLFLRAGNIAGAANLLGKLSRQFPTEPAGDETPASFPNSLTMEDGTDNGNIPIGRQVYGELGVLHLARREYTESLDALLRSGYWMDAAYVAERVLTVVELKKYVDRNWPPVSTPEPRPRDVTVNPLLDHLIPAAPEMSVRNQIRYLLARRLARLDTDATNGVFLASSNHLAQTTGVALVPPPNLAARPYYPAEWRTQFDTLRGAMLTGRDTSLTATQRTAALLTAAFITRTNGMELLGTELEPDWHVHDGEYAEGVSVDSRTNGNPRLLAPGQEELRHAQLNDVEPAVRFHYRFLAAALAFEAARLMPDNDEATAWVLWTAGTWIKNRDAVLADVYYKALVRRCRHTEIGSEADAIRWFPDLDAAGHPFPYKPRTKMLAPSDRLDYIQMFDRQEGWALNGRTDFPTNDWRYLNNAILRTTNGGLTWAVVLRAQARAQVTAYFYDADTAWATSVYDEDTNIIVLSTSDGGRYGWDDRGLYQTAPIQDAQLFFKDAGTGWLMVIPDHGMSTFPGELYHAGGGWYGGGDWQLVNRTGNWPNADDDTNAADEFAAPHPSLPCGGSMTWRDATNGWLLGSMATTTPDHLFATGDGGLTWQLQTLPVPATLPAGKMVPDTLPQFFPSAGPAGIVSARFRPEDVNDTNNYEVIFTTTDGGVTWQSTVPVKNGGVSCFLSAHEGWLWSQDPAYHQPWTAPVNGVLFHTVDGGTTWTPVTAAGGLASGLTQRDRLLQLDFVDPEYGWALIQQWNVNYPARLMQTTDGGVTWHKLP
jgi:hypothetical protein